MDDDLGLFLCFIVIVAVVAIVVNSCSHTDGRNSLARDIADGNATVEVQTFTNGDKVVKIVENPNAKKSSNTIVTND